MSNSRNTYIRTRKKTIEVEAEDGVESVNVREPTYVRSRLRQINRNPSRYTTSDTSSSTEGSTKSDSIQNSSTISTTHFRPRSRNTTPIQKLENTTQRRLRGRINTRVTPTNSMPDHDTSGSSITEKVMQSERITTKKSLDSRNPKKLRYKTRLSETDSNLTGQGIILNNEVTKSSQSDIEITSQNETRSSTKTSVDETFSSTEATSSPSTLPSKSHVSVARKSPVRGKINFRPSVSLPKTKSDTSEINEDDNYPESFKALLQAKNAAVSIAYSNTNGKY